MDSVLKGQLIRDEGLRLQAYQDTVGLWTIGVGHLLGKTARMTRITESEAMALLAADVQVAEDLARRLVPDLWLRPARYRALVNMAFNLGSRLEQFKKFLVLINRANATDVPEDWRAAAEEMLRSKWAQQVGKRSLRLSLTIQTGVDQ